MNLAPRLKTDDVDTKNKKFTCGCDNSVVSSSSEPDTVSTVSTVSTGVLQESLSQKLVREIDEAYEKDSELPEYGTTLGMVELAEKYTQKWKEIADEYYNKIIEYDGADDLKKHISDMKTNWEQYSSKQCDSYVKTQQAVYGNGSIVRPIATNFKKDLQKEWAIQVVGIYQQLNVK